MGSKLISNCCQADMSVMGSDEGTFYYVCNKCDKPCDPKQEPNGNKLSPVEQESTDHSLVKEVPYGMEVLQATKESNRMQQEMLDKQLACEKHSRILIGKKRCVDCEQESVEQEAGRLPEDAILLHPCMEQEPDTTHDSTGSVVDTKEAEKECYFDCPGHRKPISGNDCVCSPDDPSDLATCHRVDSPRPTQVIG